MTEAPRLARSLVTLRDQIDAAFPTRSKASDGWIGNAAHQAEGDYTASQHNPMPAGGELIVCAIDITDDPAAGMDCDRLMEELDAANDPRMFYEIHDGQIDNSDDIRTPYTGPNPHTKHLHISVRYQRADLYDDPRPWALPMLTTPEDDDMSMATDPDLRGAITEITGLTRSTNGEMARTATRLDRLEGLVAQLVTHSGVVVDVDEGALAKQLAPLLTGHADKLDMADLADLVNTLVNELGKRLVAHASPVAQPAPALGLVGGVDVAETPTWQPAEPVADEAPEADYGTRFVL